MGFFRLYAYINNWACFTAFDETIQPLSRKFDFPVFISEVRKLKISQNKRSQIVIVQDIFEECKIKIIDHNIVRNIESKFSKPEV